jgi:hypothetical protein
MLGLTPELVISLLTPLASISRHPGAPRAVDYGFTAMDLAIRAF